MYKQTDSNVMREHDAHGEEHYCSKWNAGGYHPMFPLPDLFVKNILEYAHFFLEWLSSILYAFLLLVSSFMCFILFMCVTFHQKVTIPFLRTWDLFWGLLLLKLPSATRCTEHYYTAMLRRYWIRDIFPWKSQVARIKHSHGLLMLGSIAIGAPALIWTPASSCRCRVIMIGLWRGELAFIPLHSTIPTA